MPNLNIQEFKWQELFTDSNGRTSPGKVVGFFGSMFSILVFCVASSVAIFDNNVNEQTSVILSTITTQSIALYSLSAALLGIRRFTKDKEIKNVEGQNHRTEDSNSAS